MESDNVKRQDYNEYVCCLEPTYLKKTSYFDVGLVARKSNFIAR